MPRTAYGALACLLFSAASVACGARTTLSDDESFGGRGGAASAGAAPTGPGGSYGAGAGGVAGHAGAAASGGVAGGGVAGSPSGESAGSAGAGGEPTLERLSEACRALCRPYTQVCPSEFPDADSCVDECMESVTGDPSPCRNLTVPVLECLGASLFSSNSCEDSLAKAAANCEYELFQLERCHDVPAPPPPDDCSGTSTSTLDTCSVALFCDNGNYWVTCEQVSPEFSSCECTSQWAITSLSVEGPGKMACSEALVRCGYGL
jgi:hypothetical protein